MKDAPEPALARAAGGSELAGGTGVLIRADAPSGELRPARRPQRRLLAPFANGHDGTHPLQKPPGVDR